MNSRAQLAPRLLAALLVAVGSSTISRIDLAAQTVTAVQIVPTIGTAQSAWFLPSSGRVVVASPRVGVMAIDEASGASVWQQQCTAVGRAHPVALAGSMVLLAGRRECGDGKAITQRVSMVDVGTGALRWSLEREPFPGRRRGYSLLGMVMATADETGDAGVSEAQQASLTVSPVTGADRYWIIGEKLEQVDGAGVTVWQSESGVGQLHSAGRDDVALFVNKDNKLQARSVVDGSLKWTADIRGNLDEVQLADEQTPVASDFFAFTSDGVYRIERASGKILWSKVRNRLDANPVRTVRTGALVLYERGVAFEKQSVKWGALEALDATTGERRWQMRGVGGSKMSLSLIAVNASLSVAKTGTILQVTRDDSDPAMPFVLIGRDAETGAERWEARQVNGENITHYRILDSARIEVSGERGLLGGIDPKTGAVIDRTTVAAAIQPATSLDGYWLDYDPRAMVLRCRNRLDEVVWSRQESNVGVPRHWILTAPRAAMWRRADGSIEVLSLATGATVHIVPAPQKRPNARGRGDWRVDVSSDSTRVLVSSWNQATLLRIAPP